MLLGINIGFIVYGRKNYIHKLNLLPTISNNTTMASFQQPQLTRGRRATRAPRRFADETFVKGSGIVGCDHFDHDYDNGDT